MFTVEERDRIRDRVLAMANADQRVVAAAAIGSPAKGPGDQWSDLDLGFGIADGTPFDAVIADWTDTLETEFGAVHLFDLPRGQVLYRVFLFPGFLQVDLSFAPASQFGARGPNFTLLFGAAAERPWLELARTTEELLREADEVRGLASKVEGQLRQLMAVEW